MPERTRFSYLRLPAIFGLAALALAGCAEMDTKKDSATRDRINAELAKAAESATKYEQPAAVDAALLPPLRFEMPKATKALEERFDLSINNAPASQVFLSLVAGTRYSMLVHPDVRGNISLNLKDVTVLDALESIRQLYGYNYKLDGTRIYIEPLTLQSRVFQVNYLSAVRKGTSDVRVVSGSVSDSPIGQQSGGGIAPTTTQGGAQSRAIQSTRISTSSEVDFWNELATAVRTIVGAEEGRSVVISPQSGVIVVRAYPNELRAVENYLKATQLSVDRQVILEAKIIEVTLNDGFQSGINWAILSKNGQNHRFSVGANTENIALTEKGAILSTIDGSGNIYPSTLGDTLGGNIAGAAGTAAGGLFSLAFQASNFAALMQFLETQGDVQVLSSPRIATLNNQKAVLKVGTDDFFVTNVSSTTTTGTATTTTPNVTLQPFFSGIVLDVTPQIDSDDNITLHIHPSISDVKSKTSEIDLGDVGTLRLPLASSTVSETDSIVRARDGQVVAIGGLMKSVSVNDKSQVPVAGEVPLLGNLFKQTSRSTLKKELVILLKPTIVRGGDWSQDILQTRDRIQGMQRNDGGNPVVR
ncbi:MAG: pilus (MSHA type) biogenesis protein MshL [Pseudomonadota bacterium]